MDKHEMRSELEMVIDDSKTAVLATVDRENAPHMRWVVPGCLRDRPGAIYTVSASQFAKIDHLLNNPRVEMMLQTPSLEKIVNVRGIMNILDNPSIRAEVLECMGSRLRAFWKANLPEGDLVVLELVIEEASYYVPMTGVRVTVAF